MMKPVMLSVYGAETVCASCVNMPTAKDTYEWLEAALKRKYPNQPFEMQYIDIHEPLDNEHAKELAEKIRNDEYFYPLVLVEDKIVGEGNPKLKDVYEEMEKHGYTENR
ncbi:YuzD family protein [Bacillus subtilis]|uniref:YuzD family protein n=1 Tax=Bacillus TaxID=1386 RepID=UPI0002C4DE2D|nr:YuzD family protein [Bacillus subtilis]AGI30346.1 putative sulfur oxido-reduction management enzyme [Bacillus subtilis subsp. subtilis str. BAB-1]AKI93385.1 disulfide oxidoreductase [Bacillus subtilis]ALS80865.1 disulfide oxidoreductase [Bacillus subtilis subsp. subtilis]ASK25212.1 putative sulfur oxido-reduction management enzyme [Bacillus subtilis]MBE1866891.1 YuzD family protein [Bacillus subtilis]